ncbi:hypothetical protein ENSA5_40770 [Enhygromyxa salina]|uniref:Uncharacterized protein n=1 Tax=Enhygromyxa salina TaxID=215803 RepID=A0A2S9XNL1_9BACT|nr:hypothetical protein [Enhygromyxa salina]PRP94458.1 hypothetical protein ENSA5_40770 [Enhygromyxa salina]
MSGDGRLRRPATSSRVQVAARLRRPAQHGAQPWRVGFASVTAAAVFALLVALTLARAVIADRVASPLAEKLAGAERIAYYVIPERRELGPSFRIGPADVSLKLITHLVLPPNYPFRAEEDFAYGMRVTLESLDGEVTWEHEVNIRTRQSKSGGAGFGWRYENAFILDDPATGEYPRELTDDRLTRVRLPKGTGDRRVRLSFVPREPSTGVQGLARVYVRRERAVDDRTLRELSLAPEVAAELVDHLTYRDWEQLTDDERRTKLSYVWERLAAEGDAGDDYDILSIYETGFRLPRGTKTDERRLVVDDARSLAINVIGPVELRVDVFGPPDLVTKLGIKRRGLEGEDVAYPSSRARKRSLEVPPGVHTLIFESPIRLELTVEAAEASELGSRVWLCEADRPMRVDEDGNEVLEPDLRRIQVVRVGVNWRLHPRWTIDGPDDLATRMFRFDVRVVHPLASSWWPKRALGPALGPKPKLDLCFLDAAGEELSCTPWPGQATRQSRFEALRLGDEDELGTTPHADTRWYMVSEPQTMRVVVPEEAEQIELRAAPDAGDQRLIVRGYGYWPEVETVIGLPFRDHGSELMRWRYPPLDTRTWFPLRPANYDELQDDKAIADLLAQVRLQPRGSGGRDSRWSRGDPDIDDRLANELAGDDGWDPGPWVTLEPRGVHRRRSILEELDDEAARRLADRWDPSLFTELRPNRTLTINFAATGPSAPQLHWQVAPRTLGNSVKLSIDNQEYEHLVAETRGRWRLPVTEGRRRVEFEFEAKNHEYEMWINRPVMVASPPVSRRRVVHELTNTLVFPLIKRNEAALTVNVVVYVLRRRERVELALSIDGGHPKRRTGVPIEHLSKVDRTYTIDADGAYDEQDRPVDPRVPIRFVDLEGNNTLPLEAVTVQVTLGEDIVPGAHEVRLELLDGGRVWARAFHRGVADRSKSATSFTESTKGSDDVGVGFDVGGEVEP